MLMDDLMQYGRGNRDLDRRIKNKCEADLIYYAILREMLQDYGVEGLRNISDIDPDALCIARDQMACLASDDKLLRFDSEERVTGFYNPDTGLYDRSFTDASRDYFIRESFLNCKALRDMVSTHLASSPAYRGRSMTDDEFEALVDHEFQERILDPDVPGSPLNRVREIAGTFNDTMGLDRSRDYYAMGMPEERMVRDEADAAAVMAADRSRRADPGSAGPGRMPSAYPGRSLVEPGDKIMVLDSAGRPNTIMGLKLSPLMPEFELLRRSGMGESLGLYKDQAEHARTKPRSRPDLSGVTSERELARMAPVFVDAYDKNNGVLMFDAQKRMLTTAPVPGVGYALDYLSKKRGVELARSNGILFGDSDYLREQGYVTEGVSYTESGYDNENGAYMPDIDLNSGVRMVTTSYARSNAGYYSSFRTVQSWKMAQVLSNYSGQRLTDGDHAAIQKIMDSASGPATIFGDPDADGEAVVNANAGAYFDYLAHVCSDVRNRMSSHEFGIHFEQQQNRFIDRERNRNTDGFLPLLYFTGERTEEYNKARANKSRYFAFYPFANYTPANVDVCPLAGDIAPASYNQFVVTDVTHRRSATDTRFADPQLNPYAHSTRIDRSMVREMRSLYDNYTNGVRRGITSRNIQLAKIRYRVGETGIDDMSRFINGDGSVNGPMVAKILIEDMNASKQAFREEFLSSDNAGRMDRIFRTFAGRNGCLDENGEMHLGGAVALFAQDSGAGTPEELGRALSDELEECMNIELRSDYGQDVTSYLAMKHVYRAYLGEFVSNCMRQTVIDTGLTGRKDELPDMSVWYSGFDDETYQGFAGSLSGRMADPSDPILVQSVKDLFGTGEYEDDKNYIDPNVPQKIILKANMDKYMSNQFLLRDYEDMVQLLAYSGYARYEPDMTRPAQSVLRELDNRAPVAVQPYVLGAYGMLSMAMDESDPDLADGSPMDDDDDAPDDAAQIDDLRTDESIWLDTVFADPYDQAKTLAWLDADYSGDRVLADTGRFDVDPRVEHAVYEARNPLKCAALRRCGEILSRSEGDFDPSRLRISRGGLISYDNAAGAPVLRLGPVIDEEAYIRPLVQLDSISGVSMKMPVLDDGGWPERDAHGTVLTADLKVESLAGIEIDENGKLVNPVSYGALDRQALVEPEQAGNIPNNRFYGISSKIRPFSGYDHDGQTFVDRMDLSTYQMGVLYNIDRCLAMHVAAKNSDGRDGIARSLFYTNVGPMSLMQCYRTNTYLMDNPAKSAVGGRILRDYMEMVNDGSGIDFTSVFPEKAYGDNELFEQAMHVASVHLSQGQAYRDRIVFPKISLDQNIGLYNQAVNLHQCAARDSGRLDVKSMRDTDSKSARVALFQDNPMLDPVISGTAKSLGAVGYLADSAKVDRLTGKLSIDPKIQAGFERGGRPMARMAYISQGIEDFEFGSLSNIAPHTGGQAFDRQQLSTVGGLKALNFAHDMKFAMINLGYNMEDGYVVAKHAARKLGHFESDGTFKILQKWDKIGDSESGNKGIVSKIVDTDIGKDMPDDKADDEFMARYLQDYLKQMRINHGGYDRNGRNGAFWSAVQAGADKYLGYGQEVDLETAFRDITCKDGLSVGDKLDELARCTAGKGRRKINLQEKADSIREDIYQGVKPYLIDIGRDMDANGVQPFTGSYKAEHAVWQLFRDNPDLEIAVTNVCVCTRSNPSILMNIGEACDRDRAAMAADQIDPDDPGAKNGWLLKHGESTLVMRNELGEKIPVMGAAGRFSVYVDSHTADDKNKDYNKNAKSPKAGRRQAAQEGYALQGERCCDAYYKFMTANDPLLPDNLAKWNRKLAMNGFLFDLTQDDMPARRVVDILDMAELTAQPDSGGLCYFAKEMPGIRFVDMQAMAKQFVERIPKGIGQDELSAAVLSMGEDQDFSKLLLLGRNAGSNTGSAKNIDDKIRHMFLSALGKDAGGMILLPEGMDGANLSVDIGLTETVQAVDDITGRTYDKQVASKIPLDGKVLLPMGNVSPDDPGAMLDGNCFRRTAPLFCLSKESADPEVQLASAPVDDKYQFRIFKTVLATAIADELHDMDLIHETDSHSRVPLLDDKIYDQTLEAANKRIEQLYQKAVEQPSLTLDNMNFWTKKNVYYFSVQDSLTCVWNGDPTLSIDEAGISFEKAKSLGILKLRDDLMPEELRRIPDTYEFMADRYKPMDENDLLVVNRSPGQTTGCIRAFYPKITGQSGDGISIHPACATIFDGDFDGDTVGVGMPLYPKRLQSGSGQYESLAGPARDELLARMSMRGNMVHEADYDDIKLPDGGEIKNVHPLFIAGNADYAVAKHNMRERDQDGVPACGYDIDREISSITVMANMLYELRNSAYDDINGADGLIMMSAAQEIIKARSEQIDDMSRFFARMNENAGTGRDQASAKFWKDAAEQFDKAREAFRNEPAGDHDGTRYRVEALEKTVFDRFRQAYDDMAGFISSKPLMTHGETQHEILHNIIRDANISKKGKEPQLNALLSYSSVGETCGGRLSVVKNSDKQFELLVDGKSGGVFDPSIRMSNQNPVSDVPKSTFLTQIESHTVAQSDKSDATGMGGAMAQKMQKLFSPAGYGAFGLRISGPITQSYLDAKQNVTKCGNNLKIGKFVLDSVAKFQKFDEFTDEAMKGADLNQIFRGQFTRSTRLNHRDEPVPEYMTTEECIQQMDHFIQVMGHPGFTKIDKAIASAVLSKYETIDKTTERLVVKDPVRQADLTGDMSYAIMYGGDTAMPEILNRMAEEHKGPFTGSFGYDGRVDAGSIRDHLIEGMLKRSGTSKDIARILTDDKNPEHVGLPDMTPAVAADIVRQKSSVLSGMLSREIGKGVAPEQPDPAEAQAVSAANLKAGSNILDGFKKQNAHKGAKAYMMATNPALRAVKQKPDDPSVPEVP